jgi:hypothetical protein
VSTPTIPAAALAEPERTAAVQAIRADAKDLLETIDAELDHWADGEPTAIRDGRDHVVALLQRLNALQALGPPS